MKRGVIVTVGLQRTGLIVDITITKGKHLRLNVWNGTKSTIHLTPKTVMVNVFAKSISVKCLGQEARLISHIRIFEQNFADRLKEEIMTQYPEVGDFSTHLVNSEMARMIVKASEIFWKEPPERGS